MSDPNDARSVAVARSGPGPATVRRRGPRGGAEDLGQAAPGFDGQSGVRATTVDYVKPKWQYVPELGG